MLQLPSYASHSGPLRLICFPITATVEIIRHTYSSGRLDNESETPFLHRKGIGQPNHRSADLAALNARHEFSNRITERSNDVHPSSASAVYSPLCAKEDSLFARLMSGRVRLLGILIPMATPLAVSALPVSQSISAGAA